MSEEIQFSFKARYFKKGSVTHKTKNVWFVLHGYGQLAEFFIRKFQDLENDETCIIAPEGLSRFYLSDTSGRVGATWMTKENRLMDIENYIQYLNAIYKKEIPGDQSIRITVLGFSQGAATASRWVVNHASKVNRLILWAGILPPDLNLEMGASVLNQIQVIEVYGKNDPYLSNEKFKEMVRLNELLKVKAELIEFDGGHEIDVEILKKLQ